MTEDKKHYTFMLVTGIASGSIPTAVLLEAIENGADVNDGTRSFFGTPLIYAAKRPHDGCVLIDAMLAKGAAIDGRRDDGRTALTVATEVGNEDIALHLVERGADIHTQDKRLHMPVMWAAEKNLYRLLKALLERGADPLFQNMAGFSALSVALDKADHRMIALIEGREDLKKEYHDRCAAEERMRMAAATKLGSGVPVPKRLVLKPR